VKAPAHVLLLKVIMFPLRSSTVDGSIDALRAIQPPTVELQLPERDGYVYFVPYKSVTVIDFWKPAV
jgi:hypothetical protein